MLFCVCLSVVVLALIGLVVLVRAALAAPYAVEDERGFHMVEASENLPTPAMSPVTVSVPDMAFFHR